MTVLVAGWVTAFQLTQFVSQCSYLSHVHILKISHPQLDVLLTSWDTNLALEASPGLPVPTQLEVPNRDTDIQFIQDIWIALNQSCANPDVLVAFYYSFSCRFVFRFSILPLA